MTRQVEIEATVLRLRRSAGIPAMAAAIVSSAGTEAVVVNGVRRTDGSDAVQPGDLFHLGSNTKAMTATLAAIAVSEGILGWDTTTRDVFGAGDATLHQLLTHSAGLSPYEEEDELATVKTSNPDPVAARREFAEAVINEPPLFRPGTQHRYSNAGYGIAAAIVEAEMGEEWQSALAKRVFQPLGISGWIGWPALRGANQPFGHWVVSGELQPHDPQADQYVLPAWAQPAGDVSLAVRDYAAFLADQLAGIQGGGRLGSAETYRSLHTPDPADAEGELAYARGWGVRTMGGRPIIMHGGSADTFYAVVVLDPQRDRGLAVVINSFTDLHESAVNGLVKQFLNE